jgi:hypothetical protein
VERDHGEYRLTSELVAPRRLLSGAALFAELAVIAMFAMFSVFLFCDSVFLFVPLL